MNGSYIRYKGQLIQMDFYSIHNSNKSHRKLERVAMIRESLRDDGREKSGGIERKIGRS